MQNEISQASAGTVTIHCDPVPVLDALLELQAAKLSPELVDLAVDLLHGGGEIARVHADRPAAPAANNVRIRLEPSDRLLGLLAAVRAGDGQRHTLINHVQDS